MSTQRRPQTPEEQMQAEMDRHFRFLETSPMVLRTSDLDKWMRVRFLSVMAWREGIETDLPPGLQWDAYITDDDLSEMMEEAPFEPKLLPGGSCVVWTAEQRVEIAWNAIRQRLRHADPPRPEHVAKMVRHYPTPDDLRGYVADLLEGNIARRRGPSRQLVPLNNFYAGAWAFRVIRWKKVYERKNARRPAGMYGADPYRNALEKVSKESGISEHTLDSWLYPRS